MSFFEDAIDVADDAVSTVWNGAGDAVRLVPGGDELLEAAGDFGRTGAGLVVLRAMSTMFYASVAWPLGPQLASVAFAVPGLVRGDDFTHAWLTEVKWRTEEAAKLLGPGIVEAFGAQLAGTLRKLAEEFGAVDFIDMTTKELIERFHVREDVAAFALAIWNHVQLPSRDEFDPVTGRQLGAWSPGKQLSPCDAYAARVRAFPLGDPRPAILNQMRAACEGTPEQRARAQEEYRALYGAREWEALGYGARERALLAPSTAAAEPGGRSSTAGVLALVVVGAAALFAWKRGLV